MFVNAALTPVQQRNLEVAVGVPVLDRVGLIIDIFAQRARTREARLQVMLLLYDFKWLTMRQLHTLQTAIACLHRLHEAEYLVMQLLKHA